MKIIDSHVHFWDPKFLTYPWLSDIAELNKAYLPQDYHASTENMTISGLVFVQADCLHHQSMEEVEWINSLETPTKAIVAFAPLEKGDAVQPDLERLANLPTVRGIRRLIQAEPLGFALQKDFILGVQSLAKYNLSFDICVFHHQLVDIVELVKQCPQVDFVLDHAGKPNIQAGLLEPWREHITALAQFENVSCKISGMITEADYKSWSPEHLQLYIEHILETFGSTRLMFGSDWPVVNLAGNFQQWFETVKSFIDSLSYDEQQAIWHSNANIFYRLSTD